jgi:hypothetical protein
MTRTAEGGKLAQTYRAQALAVRAKSMKEIMGLFPLLDLQNLDKTQARWLKANIGAIERGRMSSAMLAARFSRRFAAVETGRRLGPAITPKLKLDKPKLAKSLLYVPTRVKIGMTKGETIEQAGRMALSINVSKASTSVYAAGTDTIASVVSGTNPSMIPSQKPDNGWSRTAGPKSCEFCTMLAGRGAVYGGRLDESGVPHDFFVHETCGCTLVAAY